ncbi:MULTISPECIES: hypothetical protein [unclassified Streptomyces]|uniref:hypothetical protein n=1 Tax=unclassified Streptomyces TaxID=2593676 RepID=UPI0029B5F424|nr:MULTISPECIES: hypothetical protein [unclassified Streptomyces]MDX3766426.1 hypothetical protein [Streptomyces sp. AK08-01B]MDX3816317.1 hypothetical protein [Streptomyces sp. AK08-01A]
MCHLPTLRREHPDRMVLDASGQAVPVLIGLARAWSAHPQVIDGLFAELAKLDECVRDGIQLEDDGSAEHVRDQVARQLLTEAGGAEFHLSPKCDRDAAHQARQIAAEARRMAAALDAHANAIDVEADAAERKHIACQKAELKRLQGQIANLTPEPALTPVLPLQHPADD